jgi:hypothetical protein
MAAITAKASYPLATLRRTSVPRGHPPVRALSYRQASSSARSRKARSYIAAHRFQTASQPTERGRRGWFEALGLTDRFHAMNGKTTASDLERWPSVADVSLIAPFANGIMRNRAAVSAAIAEP